MSDRDSPHELVIKIQAILILEIHKFQVDIHSAKNLNMDLYDNSEAW